MRHLDLKMTIVNEIIRINFRTVLYYFWEYLLSSILKQRGRPYFPTGLWFKGDFVKCNFGDDSRNTKRQTTNIWKYCTTAFCFSLASEFVVTNTCTEISTIINMPLQQASFALIKSESERLKLRCVENHRFSFLTMQEHFKATALIRLGILKLCKKA